MGGGGGVVLEVGISGEISGYCNDFSLWFLLWCSARVHLHTYVIIRRLGRI